MNHFEAEQFNLLQNQTCWTMLIFTSQYETVTQASFEALIMISQSKIYSCF